MTPEGWLISKLENFIDIKHGFAFKSDYFRSEGEYVLTTPGHFFEEGGFRDQGNKTKYYAGEVPEGYVLKKGDVLLAMTEQTAGLLGSAIYVPESDKYLHNQRLGLVLVRDHERICKEYIYLIYNSPTTRKKIAEQASGTKVKHTSPSRLLGVKVLIPPLSEQKKIAQILSTWDKAIATTEQLLANSQQQKNVLIQELLTGKRRFPGGEWGWMRFSDFGKCIRGVSYKPENICEKEGNNTVRLLRSTNIQGGVLNDKDLVILPKGLIRDEQFLIDGDLAICMANGSKLLVGKSAPFTHHRIPYTVGAFCAIFRPSEKSNKRFVKFLFEAENYSKQLLIILSGSSINNLKGRDIELIKVYAPVEISEQQKIASILSVADKEIATLKQKLNYLKQEKKALIQQLLTGKRRVKTEAV